MHGFLQIFSEQSIDHQEIPTFVGNIVILFVKSHKMIPVVDPSKSSKNHHKSSIDFHKSCAKLRYAPQVHRGRDRNLIPPSLGPRAWPALVVHVFKRVLGGLERRDHGMIFVGHGQVLESDLHRL